DDIERLAETEAAYRLFRDDLGDNRESKVLDALDYIANNIQRAKYNKNPVVSMTAKFTLPFVKTPTNILKQGIEYTPFGASALIDG
ncbi:hypothetical protein, partial [Enterococcus faecium]|uniref:hypothetical protein n=1 Tax=Enterococcus faecium TaxID=1352 RepID=UPI003DA185E5